LSLTALTGLWCNVQRITSTTRFNSQSWTAPAGVTSVLLIPITNAGAPVGPGELVIVVPNTSYVVTMNDTWTSSSTGQNTFGSVYGWTGGTLSNNDGILISWVE